MDRRTFLRAAGVVSIAGLAGCSNVTSGGTPTPTQTPTDTPTPAPTPTPTPTPEHAPAQDQTPRNSQGNIGNTAGNVSFTQDLPEGTFKRYLFQPEQTTVYQITVTASPAIDVYWFQTPAEFERYREREDDPISFNPLSETTVSSTTLSAQVTSGDYRFVLDNTAVFGVEPDGEAQVRVELEFEYV